MNALTTDEMLEYLMLDKLLYDKSNKDMFNEDSEVDMGRKEEMLDRLVELEDKFIFQYTAQ